MKLYVHKILAKKVEKRLKKDKKFERNRAELQREIYKRRRRRKESEIGRGKSVEETFPFFLLFSVFLFCFVFWLFFC